MSSILTPSGYIVTPDVVDERLDLPRMPGASIDFLNARIAAGSNEFPIGTQLIRSDDGMVFTLQGLGTAARFTKVADTQDVESAVTAANSAVIAASAAAAAADLSVQQAAAVVAAAAPAVRKQLALRVSDATITDTRLIPYEMEVDAVINRISGGVAARGSAGKLMEVGIYDASFVKLSSSEVREVPEPAEFEFAIPEITLKKGRYYVGITTNSTDATFWVNPYAGALSATAAFPLPATPISPAPTATSAAGVVYSKDLPVRQNQFALTTGRTVRCYGIDTATSQPYGWNTATGRIARSLDSGATWVDLMPLPNTGSGNIVDMCVESGKLYVFTSACTLFVSSDLTASAAWTDISCPTTAGLRHAQALGRPYGMQNWNGYIWIGEYSQTGGEFAPDGPRVLRYKVADGTWALAKEFTGARHVHSFITPGSALMYVSLGDAGYGTDVGIHRIVLAGIGAGAGGTDTFAKWTSNVAPYTDHYPVDFILVGAPVTYAGKTAPAGLYGTSDRPGKHVLFSKISGGAGSFNLSAQIFRRPGGPSGETCRSMVIDQYNNIYYWTAETTENALYVTPPPYTQAVKLADYPASLFLSRAVRTGEFVLMFDQRFRVEKFVGQ